MTRATGEHSTLGQAHLAGLLVLTGVLVIRVTTSTDLFPGWGGDPLDLPSPIFGITPVLSLVLDLLALLAAAILLTRSRLDALSRWGMAAAAAGTLWVAWHTCLRAGVNIDHALPGSAWTAAIVAGLAVRAAAMSSPVFRTALTGVLVAILPLLALRACVQVWVEHPQTLAEYQASKAEFLAGQGWPPDSPQALAYERRISQPEATGWFGLANVYGTLFAAGSAFTLGMLWMLRRRLATLHAIWLVLPLGASVIGLTLTGSKGAPLAAGLSCALGVGCFAVAALRHSAARRVLAAGMGLAAVVVPLALLMVRGLVGERIGELSLLFRWFYLQASARIFAASPLAGTGPGGYKDAYFLAKNPLSPEDISSPHSILFDYAATLGVGGLLFAAVWLLWSLAAGRCAADFAPPLDDADAPTGEKVDAMASASVLRTLSLTVAVGLLAAAWLERPIATIESTLVRVVGIALGVFVLWRVFESARSMGVRPLAFGAALAGLAVIAHSQIEMTPIQLGSALWCCVAVGLGAAGRGCGVDAAQPPATPAPAVRIARLAPPALAGAVTIAAIGGLWTWERSLKAAYEATEPAGEASLRAKLLVQGRAGADAWSSLAKDLSVTLNAPVNPSQQHIEAAIAFVRLVSGERALDHLTRAAGAQPRHLPTVRAAARLAFVLSRTVPPADPRAASMERLAAQLSEQHATLCDTAPSWAWLATLRESIAGTRADTSARDAWQRAADKAPHEPMHWQRLARSLSLLGEPRAAADAATRALAADDAVRLDPLRRFNETQRHELETLARSSGPP